MRSHLLSLRERELQKRLDEQGATVTTLLAQIRSQALHIVEFFRRILREQLPIDPAIPIHQAIVEAQGIHDRQ